MSKKTAHSEQKNTTLILFLKLPGETVYSYFKLIFILLPGSKMETTLHC